MSEVVLKVEKREEIGKGAARKLRREGYVPAVIYGQGFETKSLSVEKKQVREAVFGDSKLIQLKLKGNKKPTTAMIKQVDFDPITDEILHVDFQRIKMDEKITTVAPVIIVGEEESPGVKVGGITQHGLREIGVECLPNDIPSQIEVDISPLEMGDSIRVKDLQLPEDVETTENPEEPIVTIVPPIIYEEEVEEEEIEEIEAGEVPTVAETEEAEEAKEEVEEKPEEEKKEQVS